MSPPWGIYWSVNLQHNNMTSTKGSFPCDLRSRSSTIPWTGVKPDNRRARMTVDYHHMTSLQPCSHWSETAWQLLELLEMSFASPQLRVSNCNPKSLQIPRYSKEYLGLSFPDCHLVDTWEWEQKYLEACANNEEGWEKWMRYSESRTAVFNSNVFAHPAIGYPAIAFYESNCPAAQVKAEIKKLVKCKWSHS